MNRFLREFEVIWPNPELVEVCARLRARQSGAGRQLSPADCWIAATALLLACSLIARDADFERVDGLKLIWARG